MGFPQIACPGILELVDRWDEVVVDWDAALVLNLTKAKELPFEPLADGDRQMLEAGGLIGYLHARDEAERTVQNADG